MLSKDVKEHLRGNEGCNRLFEGYDETREFGLDGLRRIFTIRRDAYRKLKKASAETGKQMGR